MTRQPQKLPTQDELKTWLSYESRTGIFRWIKNPLRGRRLIGNMAGTIRKRGYVFIKITGYGQLAAHRLAWIYCYGSLPAGMEIDHIDGNPFNNAIKNLRLATSREQKQNKCVQSNNRSGLKGAYYHACHKGKKWRSQIKVGPDLIFLGYFETAEEAHAAYSKAAQDHFGEFARTA